MTKRYRSTIEEHWAAVEARIREAKERGECTTEAENFLDIAKMLGCRPTPWHVSRAFGASLRQPKC
jgi:hypothetical protein